MSKMKITKTQRKWWVLSRAHQGGNVIDYGIEQARRIPYSEILAICKTKKEAEKLRDQNEKFTGASLDSAPEYMHQY